MPLTETGQKVLTDMKKQYGKDRGTAVFYASINKGAPGSGEWHKTSTKAKIEALKGE